MKIQRRVTTQTEVVLELKDIVNLARKEDESISANASVQLNEEEGTVLLYWSETK